MYCYQLSKLSHQLLYTADGVREAIGGTSPLLERVPNFEPWEATEIPVNRPELGRAVLETNGRNPGIMDFWPRDAAGAKAVKIFERNR
ncbi:MAG: hypothetical protein JXE07_06980, partial [Candidatus Aminicenantes bacterium]|nr:hypothetical protein [Candidatus Aminicenantes bacterium]